MPPGEHVQRLRAALGAVGMHAHGFERVGRRLQEDRIVVHDEHIQRFQAQILALPVGNGDVDFDREGRALARGALAVDGAAHQVHHLLGDGEAQARALNAVDAAVRLAGEGLVHLLHERRGHADAIVRHGVAELHAAGHAALLLAQVHAHAAAGLGVLDGVGENVDVDLVQAKLVGIEIFLLHVIDAEAEVDVLLLDHRLGDVDQVLGRLHDGEGQRAQGELAALHLGDIQDVVDERQQMAARKADFPEVLPHRLRIAEVLLRYGGQPDDRIHGGADIVGHGGQKIRLGTVGRLRLPRHELQAPVDVPHVHQIQDKERQKPQRDH